MELYESMVEKVNYEKERDQAIAADPDTPLKPNKRQKTAIGARYFMRNLTVLCGFSGFMRYFTLFTGFTQHFTIIIVVLNSFYMFLQQ